MSECWICGCDPCASRSFCRACRKADRDRAAGKQPTQTGGLWWPITTIDPEERARPTPRVTIEAVMFAVRKRGLRALTEPATLERLARCDAAAKAQIEQRIAKLMAEGRISSAA